MYRVDIFTDVGVYTALLDGNTSEAACSLAYEIERDTLTETEDRLYHAIDIVRNSIKSLVPLFGWTPLENPVTVPPMAFSIEPGSEVKHIKTYVYQVQERPTETPTEPVGRVRGLFTKTWHGEYLGQKIAVHIVGYEGDHGTYLLPVTVNGKPAVTAMKPAALTQQLQLMQDADGIPPTDYEIVIPDVPVDPAEAAEYLKDYADDTPTRLEGSGKGKAWYGWGDKNADDNGPNAKTERR